MLKLGLIGFMKILGTSQFFMAWVEGYRRILENHVPKEYKAGNIENWLQIPPIGKGGEWGRIVRILQSLKGELGKFDLDTTKILRPLQVQQWLVPWVYEYLDTLILGHSL